MAVKTIICLLLLSQVISAQTRERSRSRRMWLASVAALVAANAVDAHSSVGRYEANPLLRGRDGRYSMSRGVGVKLGLSGSLLGAQALVRRSDSGYTKPFTVMNIALAGALGGVALRNYGIAPAAPGR